MAKKVKLKSPVPDSLELWVAEIAMAFKGAQQFMKTPLIANIADVNNMQSWQVAPLMALGARGLTDNEDLLDESAGYAFSCFEENYGIEEADALPQPIAFAFVYVATHVGLKAIDEMQADTIMDVIEANQDTLSSMIAKADELIQADNPFGLFMLASAMEGAPPKAPALPKGRKPAKVKAAGAAGKTEKKTRQIYLLEVTLEDTEPRIWRRVAVPDDYTLKQLNWIMGILFGWDEGHLHEFTIGKQSYSSADYDLEDTLDESEVRLRDLIRRKGQKFHYLYDFGDNWQHEIVVKQIGPPSPDAHYPSCEAGERAAPPEDCGGPWGYEDILAALKDPKNEGNAERLEWLGENFDPDAFDLDKINKSLKKSFKS